MMKQRLEWLDALRGFTMLMVVANHVFSVSFGVNPKYSMFMSVCLLFRMPLFFFISGFLAYKATFSWNAKDTWQLVRKKLRVQIIPTLFFMTAFIALFRKPFWKAMETAWLAPTKDGYWFTLVLLEMLLAYYAICFIANRVRGAGASPSGPSPSGPSPSGPSPVREGGEVTSGGTSAGPSPDPSPVREGRKVTSGGTSAGPSPDPSPVREGREVTADCTQSPLPNRGGAGGGASGVGRGAGASCWLFWTLLWLIAFFGYTTLYMPKWFHWQKDIFWHATSLTEFVRYFHCFLLGNLCHRHWQRLCHWLDTPGLTVALMCIAFFGAADYLNWHTLRLHWANLPRTLAMYSLVLLCVAFFRHYAEWFRQDHIAGRTLQFIGMRTLDVYLLHYFFLPHLSPVGQWFKDNPHNFVLEGTAAIVVALLVTAFTLLASQLFRVSPLFRKWLFGREN